MSEENRILSKDQINKILKRIAIEVVENNYHLDELIIIGISGQGFQVAKQIEKGINETKSDIKTSRYKLSIDKADPASSEIRLNASLDSLSGKTVLLVDDVMNTGRTQAYSLSYLLQVPIKKLETAILVNRSHGSFPIAVNYNGIALSTTIDDHIEVRLETKVGAYLY